jgi:hypothetical protein
VILAFNGEEYAAGRNFSGVDTYACYGGFVSGNVFGFYNFSKFFNI